ncbi:MAG: DUF3786 domain-containing protein [Pseudomonadota bacterium]
MNPLDIIQRTPKTNCGECGYPACLAFAANVARSDEDPRKCPYINLDGLVLANQKAASLDGLKKKHDLDLIRHLQEKISGLDFALTAPALGIPSPSENTDIFSFSYLGQQVRLSKKHILIDGRVPEDPRDQILLYNYIHSGGGNPPSGSWIGLESLPNSISKVKTLATYCEDRLAQTFTGMPGDEIISLCKHIGAEPFLQNSADVALTIPVLPRLPQKLLFWDEEPEDGFPAKVKILYDVNVLDYLDLESLVFSSERMAERILHLFSTSP